VGWVGRKKIEEKKSKEKNIELQNKSYNDNVNSNTPDNLIYQGPMSGMEEALNKFKETGEKTGDVR
jgi:molybdopterin-guanine dinucleotide biosynthesis protein A